MDSATLVDDSIGNVIEMFDLRVALSNCKRLRKREGEPSGDHTCLAVISLLQLCPIHEQSGLESYLVGSTRRARMFEIRNTKHETRNKFEITSTKIQNGSVLDTQQLLPVSLVLFRALGF